MIYYLFIIPATNNFIRVNKLNLNMFDKKNKISISKLNELRVLIENPQSSTEEIRNFINAHFPHDTFFQLSDLIIEMGRAIGRVSPTRLLEYVDVLDNAIQSGNGNNIQEARDGLEDALDSFAQLHHIKGYLQDIRNLFKE